MTHTVSTGHRTSHDSQDVHFEDRPNLVHGELSEGLVVLGQVFAGVVDQNADVPDPPHHLVDRGDHLIVVGDIAGQRHRAQTFCLQGFRRSTSRLGVDISQGDGPSLRGQGPSEPFPETDGTTGDQGDLPWSHVHHGVRASGMASSAAWVSLTSVPR